MKHLLSILLFLIACTPATLSPEECLEQGGRTVNIVGGDTCNADEENIGKVVGFISPNICCKVLTVACTEEAKICPDGVAAVGRVGPNCEFAPCPITIEQALDIAKTACSNLTENYNYNYYTGTWWIDLAIEKAGCAPACVVDVEDKTAEINWRCTGLIE